MTTPVAPAGGFFLRLPGLPDGRVVRAVRVEVAESASQAFSDAVASRGDAARLAFDRVVWNSTMVELAALATTIAAPYSNVNATTGDVRYQLRLSGDVPARGATTSAVEGGTGRPVLGAPLLALRLPLTARQREIVASLGEERARLLDQGINSLPPRGIESLDPAAEGIGADESLRRTWVLALYEELSQAGRRAVLTTQGADRAGGFPWVVAGGVVLVGVAVAAVVYGVERAEISAQQAVELEILRNGARGMEERLRQYVRTGTMPPVTPAEEAAQSIATARANAGVSRAASAASDAIREAGKGLGTAFKIVAGGFAIKLLIDASKD